MCAQFTLKAKVSDLDLQYKIKSSDTLEQINERFLPYKTAPVVVSTAQDPLRLVGMSFSLVPSWSKEAKVKFATHNARLETVLEKPTWKIPFQINHCVIPLTGFFESVYEGPLAGHMIQFAEAKGKLMFVAGIYDRWTSNESNKSFHSFSILTTEPDPFIAKNGHDRSPLFLGFEDAKAWLTLKSEGPNMIDFLKRSRLIPELQVVVDRPLKAGWEKRK